ncbi:hypothetical protein LQU94_00960 [Peptoniphilus sp. KCTC 25270]|uniref:hypothetical protein n=1 Tax=Peptoniphilus sp. KCTC 25270 TaxID=2897414 RepID=UPI001E399C02|nr:hypothetical protein [Peptoniphilus sp. KCTC 25270]MCD1146684.1 hypothetical protein [Peptoniphilus sp. KCTC 25270]
MRNKQIRRLLLLFIIIIAMAIFLKRNWNWVYTIEPEWQKNVEYDLDEIHILSSNRMVLWDGDTLEFLDKKGETVETVDRTGEGQVAYFGDSKVLLFDGDLRKVTVFDEEGVEEISYTVEGELFAATEQNGNVLLHVKKEKGEILYLGDRSGGLEILFETDHNILDYEVENSNSFIVSELSNEAGGYKTTLYKNTGEFEKEEFSREVSMEIGFFEGKEVMVTEKNLYLIDGEEIQSVEIPLMSDVYFGKSKIYLLHSGILTIYNKKLEEIENEAIAANVNQIENMENSIYVHGNNEGIGNPLSPRAFHFRLEENAKIWEMGDNILMTFSDRKVKAYTFHKKMWNHGKEIQLPRFKEGENKID